MTVPEGPQSRTLRRSGGSFTRSRFHRRSDGPPGCAGLGNRFFGTDDVAPVSDAETSPLSAQDHASMPEAIVCDADVPPLSEVAVPEVEIPVVSGDFGSRKPSPPLTCCAGWRTFGRTGPDPPSMTPRRPPKWLTEQRVLDVPVESPAVERPQRPHQSATAAPEATAEDGPRILWDDSSSKPMPSASTGNMLTRWLSKPKDVAPAEASQATTMPQEPISPSLRPWRSDRDDRSPDGSPCGSIGRVHALACGPACPAETAKQTSVRVRRGATSVAPWLHSSARGYQRRSRWLFSWWHWSGPH